MPANLNSLSLEELLSHCAVQCDYDFIRELRRREERERRLREAAGLVAGMAAVWQVDPDKSPNTMNVGFAALRAALAEYNQPASTPR